jgi:hypothetical protein
MNRRGKRLTLGVTITAAALGVGLVAALAIADWRTIRDHLEAWRFQMMRATDRIPPGPLPSRFSWTTDEGEHPALPLLFCMLANHYGHPVIFDAAGIQEIRFPAVPATEALEVLKAKGWRVIEQRVPQPAHVILRPRAPAARPAP